MPTQADTSQDDGFALLVAELATLYLQLTILLDGFGSVYMTCKHGTKDYS
jgi:hypothetical protein